MKEEWRSIQNYPDYLVSNIGRVKRMTGWRNRPLEKPHILKSSSGGTAGYPSVWLYRNAKSKRVVIHHLVAIAFLGPKPLGSHINHKNFDRRDNKFTNLEYVTPRENVLWTKLHLRHSFGEHRYSSKLSDDKIDIVRKFLESGCTISCVAYRMNVSRKVIYDIVCGKTWKHITQRYPLQQKNYEEK